MHNPTQLERYKKLITFLEEHFMEELNIERIEQVCLYSYRNINRIFQALHQETIGKYIKRLRLEKAAQYLIYSNIPVSDIAYEVGFEDRAAFSKAFKNKYGYAPSIFRERQESQMLEIQAAILPIEDQERIPLKYEIAYLSDFDYLFLEYRGDHEDITAINQTWEDLETYATRKNLLSERSIFMTQIIDDELISDQLHSRYNSAFILDKPLDFIPEGLFRTKRHQRQKYAKFQHYGSYQSCFDFYGTIYAFWMQDVGLEFVDRPLLEFYPNYGEETSSEEMLTEIYIPVQ